MTLHLEMPQSTASKSLKFITVIVAFVALYFSKLILLPIMIAGFIALFSSRLVHFFVRLRCPKALASLLVVMLITAILSGVFSLISTPAIKWIESSPILGERLIFEINNASDSNLTAFENGAGGNNDNAISKAVDSTLISLTSLLAQFTLLILAQVGAIAIMTFFFLCYGEDLIRSIVKAQSTFSNKKLTVTLFQAIRDDVTMYVLVISLINLGLGAATAAALTLIQFEDALLWGALAAILNFAPYVGPLLLAVILTSVGFTAGDSLAGMLIAPGLFLCLNLIESQFVTPTILGKRFNTNPLLVVLWMFIWGFLWGASGLLLAIPTLMCFKLIATHLNLFGDWIVVLDGNHHPHSNV